MKKFVLAFAAAAALLVPSFAKNITFKCKSGDINIDIPDDIAGIIDVGNVTKALDDHGVTQSQVDDIQKAINDGYAELREQGIATPYHSAVKGISEFSDNLLDTIPNSQSQQDIWAKAWIGKLFHFGAGVNAGVATIDITPLKDAAKALTIDVDDAPNTLVFPTVAADIRLGGIVLPFDIGFSFLTIDTTKYGSIDESFSPCTAEYFTIGANLRYAVIHNEELFLKPTVSIIGGGYYTSGKTFLKQEDSESSANVEFDSTTFYAGVQGSVKLLIFYPYAGARVLASRTNVKWGIDPDWNDVLSHAGDKSVIEDALKWNILPKHIGGESSSNFFDHIRPQFYGGIMLRLLCLDLTVGGSYDFVSDVLGASVSARISF